MFYGSTGKFADLLPTMVKHKSERYFIPLSDVHNDEIKNNKLLHQNEVWGTSENTSKTDDL